MQRLFGIYNRGKHVAAVTGGSGSEEKVSKCTVLIFVVRLVALVAASVCGGLVTKAAHEWSRDGVCLVLIQLAATPATASNSAVVDVMSGGSVFCHGGHLGSLFVTLFAVALALVCAANLKSGRVVAQPGIMPKIELALKVVALVVMIMVTCIAFSKEKELCMVGRALGSSSADGCAAQLDSITAASCAHCKDRLFDGVLDALLMAQKNGLACCGMWALLVLLAALRHWRAARREASLKVARALDEAEMKDEFERRKAEELKQKEMGQGAGKGAVYRLLM
jgi:hypothetical protein